MELVLLPFRLAVIEATDSISYLNQLIPVCDEYLNRPAAILPVGNNKPVKAWIRLTNQTGNNNSNKCRRNDRVTIQVQCRVAFNANSGGYVHSEAIANEFLSILFPVQNDFVLPIDDPFHVWDLQLESSNNINFQDDTDRIWMTYLLISAQVEQ
jgi:hypothetical protein